MSTTYTHEKPYGSAASIAYNADFPYNTPLYNYIGQAITVWTHQSKS